MDFAEKKIEIERKTGFVCYEDAAGHQNVWYGTSDKFDEFKTLVNNYINTGDMVMLIDTQVSKIYSKFKNMYY